MTSVARGCRAAMPVRPYSIAGLPNTGQLIPPPSMPARSRRCGAVPRRANPLLPKAQSKMRRFRRASP